MARRTTRGLERVELRPLRRPEQRLLTAKLRDLKLPARLHQRYRIIAAARSGDSVPTVARRVGCAVSVAYLWVDRFNASGFTTFERVPNPRGRESLIAPAQLRELVDVALSNPRERGLPFSTWTVATLAAYCRAHKLLPPVTDEWVRRLLRRQGLSAQRIRTWKTSHDPQFDSKKNVSARSTVAAYRARASSASTNGGRWS